MIKKKFPSLQVFYNDRWINKEHFRAFVYKENEQKIAESYEEYERLITSGLWFSSKDKIVLVDKEKSPKARKPKDDSDSS